MAKKTPRGVRNNNPLNIRVGNNWLGEVAHPTDKAFEQFVTLEFGFRAAFKLLQRYITKYKRRTIRTIISAWAPANENNTNAYIQLVSKRMGISPNQVISFEDKNTMCALAQAMGVVECSTTFPMATIAKGYDMATGKYQ